MEGERPWVAAIGSYPRPRKEPIPTVQGLFTLCVRWPIVPMLVDWEYEYAGWLRQPALQGQLVPAGDEGLLRRQDVTAPCGAAGYHWVSVGSFDCDDGDGASAGPSDKVWQTSGPIRGGHCCHCIAAKTGGHHLRLRTTATGHCRSELVVRRTPP